MVPTIPTHQITSTGLGQWRHVLVWFKLSLEVIDTQNAFTITSLCHRPTRSSWCPYRMSTVAVMLQNDCKCIKLVHSNSVLCLIGQNIIITYHSLQLHDDGVSQHCPRTLWFGRSPPSLLTTRTPYKSLGLFCTPVLCVCSSSVNIQLMSMYVYFVPHYSRWRVS